LFKEECNKKKMNLLVCCFQALQTPVLLVSMRTGNHIFHGGTGVTEKSEATFFYSPCPRGEIGFFNLILRDESHQRQRLLM